MGHCLYMKILLVEDEPDIVHFLKPALEAECFVVDVATDGNSGLRLAKVNDYDIIILDNMLPERNGIDVCRDIREAGKSVPIIMLSVIANSQTKVELLNAGADDYITKPFSFEELLARIHALLRRPKKVEDEILSIDDLTLDIRRKKVIRKNKEIYLTRKEFMLLEYLLRNKGIVLSRGMIMEHVWDMNADPFSNTIESHILSLRKKIKAHGGKKLIFTVPGRGYRIE